MDWNEQPNHNEESYGNWESITPPPPAKPANALAVAAFIFGILATLTLCTIYLPIIFGSLSIVFALLSKGSEKRMHSLASSGIASSVFALIVTALMFIFVFIALFSNETYRQEVQHMYEEQYEDMYREIYGDSYNDLIDEFFEQFD